MTQPEAPKTRPEISPAVAEGAEAAPPEGDASVPEPWTPERVSEWNNYYDIYVMMGVLLLAFLVSANKIQQSPIWARLQVGRVIAATGSPALKDPFTYTEGGRAWVNVGWLFDVTHALIYRAAYDLAPAVPSDRTATEARADQVGAGALVAFNALAYVLAALVLMNVRREGPGRWWSACCVGVALGALVTPGVVVLGGIAGTSGPAAVGPGVWGLLMLAVEVWLLFRAADGGRRASAFALVPLFVVWANVDESFLIGLVVLAACALGRFRRGAPGGGPGAFGPPVALGVLAACAAACLVNPSLARVYGAAAEPFLALLGRSNAVLTADQLSFFGAGLREQTGRAYPLVVGFYLLVVGAGYASFVLNRKRFALSRFLMYTAGVVLWGAFKRYAPEFSVLFAAAVALNGQEWYQGRFGTAGRVGPRWSVWSVGGRAVTLLALFLCVAKVLLGGLPVPGFESTEGDGQFGFGYDRDDFAFEVADFLKTAPIRGNVLNTTKAEGDAVVWRSYPARKAYIDNRRHLFPADVFNRLQDARRALSTDDVGGWKPLLDEYKVSAVMVSVTSPRTYQALSRSENWVPFYDDGAVVLFGRADAPAADLAFFKANRLDPDAMAYARQKPTPATERPPTPVSWMDNVFRTRERVKPQPHDTAAQHWLSVTDPGTGETTRPDPARCLLAIREARTALASKPDDPTAFRLLALAYRELMAQESALLAGIALTPENSERVGKLNASPALLGTRFRQLVTALNYAVQSTPPPRDPAGRQELRRLNVELFQLLMSANFLDLARDRLQAVLDRSPLDAAFQAEDRAQISRDLAQLNERVKQVEEQITTMTTEQQVGPAQLARFAVSQGAPGLAIHELEEAERTATNPAQVKPLLLDLYCDTGQPEKAVEMLSSGTIDDPSLGAEPGASAMRQGRVYFLLGNAEYSGTLWSKYAIPRLRADRALRALEATRLLLRGEGRATSGTLLEVPGKVSQQADWEFEAGLCRLEGGFPAEAAAHFTTALTLSPTIGTRPIIAYYLGKLGKAVPPAPAADTPAGAKPQKVEAAAR